MEPLSSPNPIVVIVGPTASGKTDLAFRLAQEYRGEIISADSRTIYRGMDIGTAKPTKKQQQEIPHWGIDIVEPGERYTVADFQQLAKDKIKEIQQRNNVPFLVGGTGLYIDSVVFDYHFKPPSDPEIRRRFEDLTITELQNYCIKNDISLPENKNNKRYLIRAIENGGINTTKRNKPLENTYIVGITTDKEDLKKRISRRTEEMFNQGVIEEALRLSQKYGWESEAMTSNVYRLIHQYIQKELSYEQMKEKNITADWRLAKRQLTWLRRNPYIHWLSLEEAELFLRDILSLKRQA